MNPELAIQRATRHQHVPTDGQFQQWSKAIELGGREGCVVAIRVVDEDEAQRFNRQYRGQDYATNVLSFPAELPPGLPGDIAQSCLGDLLICAPVVAREAREQGKPEDDHWAHLAIHGILHLLGYDHRQDDEALIMESLETEILARLGVPDPYRHRS